MSSLWTSPQISLKTRAGVRMMAKVVGRAKAAAARAVVARAVGVVVKRQ